MNTLEIKIKNKINSFDDLYKLAYQQFVDYEKLEGIKNWNKYDFSIDCFEDQMKFKDMLQIRFIEELTEASLAREDKDHFLEEITDSLNFLLSAYLMYKGPNLKDFMISPDIILKDEVHLNIPAKINSISVLFYPVIEKVGGLCNLLKNRPWTQSNYLVSLTDFEKSLENLWIEYWKMIKVLGINKYMIFELFERKYLVNKWRMKTGY